ncbi:hypothetical protein CTEN210_18349 [Chaetoceros tenuissimus]|uniref:HSF-type DNA-binding domain-containing protein n=1 Tax=Chaetoceros tenuissimus TaxID=426638 RepID=A0AAD3DCH0_9STRA|nr:hypothetical protein CTEN210_18349 [Chaetoceros tenuissimus]
MTTYNDYAHHTDVFVKRTGPGRKGLVFPLKLFLLVLKYIDLKEPHLKTIISWNHHGRSFKIHDHKQFRQIILPRFANISKETFRRQLSFWGFRRISASGKKREEIGSYYHEKFLRTKDYLWRLIRRNGASGPLLDSEEPDFERMKAMPTSEQRRLTAPESDDELFAVLLSSSNDASARTNSNQSSSLLSPNANVDAMSMNPSLVDSTSLSYPLNNSYVSHQEASSFTNSNMLTSAIYPPPTFPMQTCNTSSTNQEESNERERQTYQNIDLEQLLSDENEWQWRHLQPFPIGFQPPLSQSESEEFDQFLSFVRSKKNEK